jgi:uncharacterized protein (TIGR03435 family)
MNLPQQLLFSTIVCITVFGQQARPEFEVASIRPVTAETGQITAGVHVDDAQVRFTRLSLKDLIGIAYKVKIYQISGPDWLASERFNINATVPTGANRDQMQEMVQNLLADRFQLKMHRTSKEFPVYGLVPAKSGFKLKELPPSPEDSAGTAEESKKPLNISASGGRSGTTVNYGNGSYFAFGNNKFEAKKMTMANVADTLARFVDKPVVDMTELKGNYDFNLDFSQEDFQAMMIRAAVAAGVSLPPQALQYMEKASGDSLPNALTTIGLKLESRKAPIEVLVIDHVLKLPTEN